jgi:Oxygen-sensitive ribonucleoside-triphosphate reductase
LAIETQIQQIKKRDGRIVRFEPSKITEAIWKAIKATGSRDRGLAEKLSYEVVRKLEELFPGGTIPSVEDIQDVVEHILIEKGEAKVAKAYILYRQKRAELREEKKKY